ncbi:MAG: hypothetical protein H7839_03915 [Magnetococcus sp. YQC-5]
MTTTPSLGVRWGLLALLPVITLGVWLEGQRYDPGLLDFKSAAVRLSPLVAFFPDQVAGLHRLGELRRFSKENLHEYVNGHAEFFITAGFQELVVGEYGRLGETGRPQVVVDIYEMGKPLFAFGVVTQETQPDAQPSLIGEMGNADSRGLRFILGSRYIKMTAFEDGVPLETLGRTLVQSMGKMGSVGIFHFPEFGTPLTTRFVKESYRGLDFFNNVIERSFQWQDRTIQAFLAGDSATASQELERRLTEFLQQEKIPVARVEQDGLVVYVVTDPYEGEWFFLRNQEQVIGAFGMALEAARTPLKRFVEDGNKRREQNTHQ